MTEPTHSPVGIEIFCVGIAYGKISMENRHKNYYKKDSCSLCGIKIKTYLVRNILNTLSAIMRNILKSIALLLFVLIAASGKGDADMLAMGGENWHVHKTERRFKKGYIRNFFNAFYSFWNVGINNDFSLYVVPPAHPEIRGKIVFHSYTSYDAGDSQLFIYDFDKDTLLNISFSWTGVSNPMNAHFSPGGKKLTFMGWNSGTTDWDIFLWDTQAGGQPVNLTNARNNREEDPKFSPCGKKIIYKERYWDGSQYKYRFVEMNLTGEIVNIIDPPGDDEVSMPFYTPDNLKIIYSKGAGGSASIWRINTDGSGDEALQDNPGIQEYYPVAINDSRYFFTRWLDAGNHTDQVYMGEGGSRVRLPFNDDNDYSDACYIRDNYAVVSSTRPGGEGGYDLYIVDIKSGDVWSLQEYFAGINTSKEELGACYCYPVTEKAVASHFIALDNLGYMPGDGKIAILRDPVTGYDAQESYTPASTYYIKKVADSTVVLQVTPQAWNNGVEHQQSGDIVWWLDFSGLTAEGDYFITGQGEDTGSFAFTVGDTVYDEILKQSMRTFYYQRCGIAKELPYADSRWTDNACHLGAEQDGDCRLVTNPVASTSKDLSGGWHDAGDYSKYINYTDVAVHDLLAAYEENPGIWGDNNGIPESGNGIPDILDEVKWELDWMLKMQENDGGVHHKVSYTEWVDTTSPPSFDRFVRRYAPVSASATINSCGVFAHAAIVFKSLPVKGMQAYGDSLREAALRAWNWIDTHASMIPSYYDNAGFITPVVEDTAYTQLANITAAASYLLVLTADTAYRDYFDAHYRDTHLFTWEAIDNYFKDPQINEALLYYSVSPLATDSVVAAIKSKYLFAMSNPDNDFSPLKEYDDSTDAYRAFLDLYDWGSNRSKSYAGSAFTNLIVYGIDTANNQKYRDAAMGYVHYLHGTNPLRQLYFTNFKNYGGENSVPEFYHEWFKDGTGYDNVDTCLYGPPPGFLTGGPNTEYESPGSGTIEPPENQPAQKSYKNWNNTGDESWEITEGQDAYQSAYTKLLSFFVNTANSPATQQYYVSVNGDNSNPGTLQLPWRDIDYACHNAVPGSTINVMTGTYFEQVEVAVDSIKVCNYLGQKVILDGSNINDAGALLTVSNRQNVTIEGLELQNYVHNDAQGILITGKSKNITVRNCKIHDIHFSANAGDQANENTNTQPLIVYGDSLEPLKYLTIENNEIYNCRTGYSEGLAVNGNVDTFIIKNNIIHDITNIGIDIIGHEGTCSAPSLDQARNGTVEQNTVYNCSSPYAANAGIYIDGAKNITLDRNTCYRNIWGIEIGCENTGKSASNIKVKNNVIYRNAKSGIAVGGFDYPGGSGKVTDTYIYNNTLYDNDTLNAYEGEINISYAEDCWLKNNIVYAKNTDNLVILQYSDVAPAGVVLDSNIYYHPAGAGNVEFEWQNTGYTGFGSWQAGSGQDANTIFGDPAFVDINTFPPDLHLTASSPAVETGTDYGDLHLDRDSLWRPMLARADKGAYEYGIYWKGAQSHDWHTAGNWSNGIVPLSTDEVTIPPPAFYNYYPELNSNAQVKKIYLYGNSLLKIKQGAVLELGN